MARKDGKDRGLFERPKDSGIWWIQYADSTGKKRREKAGMKRAAQALYTKRKREAREGIILPVRVKKVIFAEIVKEALTHSKARNASWKDDENRSVDLLEEFGKLPADSIDHRMIEKWMHWFKEQRELAPSTINKYRALMSAVYSYALAGKRVNTNPVRLTKPMKLDNSRTRVLEEDEDLNLYKCMSFRHFIEVEFALHTGVRRATQFNLRWDQYNDGVTYFPRSKNGREQYIPLNSYLRGLLAHLESALFPGMSGVEKVGAKQERPYVFQDSHDELIRNNRLNWWYDALEGAGIKEFRWHDLRHTFATRLIRKTNNIRLVQDALNQKSAQMTVRYTHILDTDMREALEGLVG